jgi:hypothetical protein
LQISGLFSRPVTGATVTMLLSMTTGFGASFQLRHAQPTERTLQMNQSEEAASENVILHGGCHDRWARWELE